jgi:hypothetical protein
MELVTRIAPGSSIVTPNAVACQIQLRHRPVVADGIGKGDINTS